MDDVVKLDNIVGVKMELLVGDVKEGDKVKPVDGTTEELPKVVERVDEPKLLSERGVDLDSD